MRPVHLCQSASSAVQFPLFISENKRYTVTFQSNQRDPETYAIIGAAIDVHKELGNGFLEAVYQDALEKELALRCIPFVREQSIPILYKGKTFSTPYRADFVCFQRIIVELKALKKLSEIEDAQVLHYLKATQYERALLFNFGSCQLETKRFINSIQRSSTAIVSTADFTDERR